MRPDSDVDELAIEVANLRIRVTRTEGYRTTSGLAPRHTPSSSTPPDLPGQGSLAGPVGATEPLALDEARSASSWSVVCEEAAVAAPWTEAWLEQLFSAGSPAEIEAVDLAPVAHLRQRIRTTSAGWSPLARLGRALRAGILARRRLDNNPTGAANLGGPTLPSRFYIILKAAPERSTGWTEDYHTFPSQVRGRGHDFFPGTISQAFASRAEADAYLVGAQLPWPAHLPRQA